LTESFLAPKYCPVSVRRRGFTLIELLGVLAIMGILLAALFPAVSLCHRSSLRHRSQWQLLEIKSALESYRIYYGEYPSFLANYETPIAINECLQLFLWALQGTDNGIPNAINPDNVRFMEFSRKMINGNGRLVDRFGNDEIYLLLRRSDALVIKVNCFPEHIHKFIPADGLMESIAIYSINTDSRLNIVSWEL
jgi:prepilin-type N-terminal cleavage/methylation domain-containing protein